MKKTKILVQLGMDTDLGSSLVIVGNEREEVPVPDAAAVLLSMRFAYHRMKPREDRQRARLAKKFA